MKPVKSYRIWFSQRNGSTLLCRGLEQTGVAGQPGEFFNVMENNSLLEKFSAKNYTELKNKMWQEGTSQNGVFGIKHSLHHSRYQAIRSEIEELKNREEADDEKLLADLFPNCRHIFMTRRNKVRQAVSWWKAIKDQVWHLEAGQSQEVGDDFFEEHYNYDALLHLLKETVLRECSIQAYFSQYNIQPLTLVYEDFIQDFSGTIKTVLDYLEITDKPITESSFPLEKTAVAGSEIWVNRFRADLQKGWDNPAW